MATKNYSKSRAIKKSNSSNISSGLSSKSKNKVLKSIKKSPILIVAVLFLIIGVAAGYFAYKMLSSFEMNTYLINDVSSAEIDYVVLDISAIKEEYLKIDSNATIDEIYNSINLEDKSVTCKFFGIDISDTISTKFYYREDISHDVVEVDIVDVKTPGVYYIEYTSNHFAFKNRTLIRTIVVLGVENDG